MVLFIGSFIFLIAAIILLRSVENQYCMGVPLIPEKQLNQYTETTALDISQISFDGKKVAVDWEKNSIYISQSAKKLAHWSGLLGEITATNSEYSLYFLKNSEMKDLTNSVREGIPLTLIIQSGLYFQRVNVVLTTLPVLYLDIDGTYMDEEQRNIVHGKLTLWNSLGSAGESYHTETSNAEWHMRGNSTRIYPKLSWKVNLRDEHGQNKNLNLLGLGSDDDWILNPMSMDDTFIKEKLAQELWNQLAKDTDYNYQMSTGQYVEVLINGAYQGVYMLQRRIDAKYLKLNKEADILMKGINLWEADSIRDAYEIVSTPFDEEQSYQQLQQALSFQNESSMNIQNFVDVSLLLQFLSGVDNYGYKNTFYVLRKSENAYELHLVPWDTDLSLGVPWGYDYEGSMNEMIERQELETVRKNVPDIDKQISKRWRELRNSIYSEENILSIYNELTDRLTSSGALQRDEERWGLLHEGEDNWENLQRFIKERLQMLDNYYM